jgi:hypothetical protein
MLHRFAPLIRFVGALAFAAMLGSASACGHVRAEDKAPTAMLEFSNESAEPTTVYVLVPSVSMVRLGKVSPGERRRFIIPSRIVRNGRNVIVVARLNRGRVHPETIPLLVHGGDLVQVLLPITTTQLIVQAGW